MVLTPKPSSDSIKKLQYLTLLATSSRDINRLPKAISTIRATKWLQNLESRLNPTQARVFNAFRSFSRLFGLLFCALTLYSKTVMKVKNKSILKFTTSISLLLTINPLLKAFFKPESLSGNLLPNLITSLPLAIYPNSPLFQKNYFSIYLLVLLFEHGYKLLECLNSKISAKRHHLKYFNQSWLIFPFCYSLILEDYFLHREKCPKHFVSALDYLKEDITLNKHLFVHSYIPDKLLGSFKVVYPLFLFKDIKAAKNFEAEMVVSSLQNSTKALITGLSISSMSLFLISATKSYSKMPITNSSRLRSIGFVSGLLTFIYKNDNLRSFWLYLLRMTLLSHFKSFKYKLDKILIITNLTLLLTVNDIYKKKTNIFNTISTDTSLNYLLNTISKGDILS